jgi:hypothetical protein
LLLSHLLPVHDKILLLQSKYGIMELTEVHQKQTTKKAEEFDEKNFKPRGAFAFFILLVILGMAIWYGIYFLMLERV